MLPTNQNLIPLEQTELPTLGNAQNADELAAAAILFAWHQEHHNIAPAEQIVPWKRFVSIWLHRVTREEMAVVDRNLEMVIGDTAMWVPWPPNSESPYDVRALYKSVISIAVRGTSGKLKIPILDVMAVHRRWLDIPKPRRPDHPLVTVITLRQVTPEKARISQVMGMTLMPYVASEALRRSWLQARSVFDVELNGNPLIDHLSVQRHENSDFQRRLYVDKPTILDARGGLHLNLDESSNIFPQDARVRGLPLVAWPGYQGWIRQDLWLLLAAVYGSTSAIVWTEEEGARFLARNRGGGPRKPTAADITRWRVLIDYAASIEIWSSGWRGSRFVKLVYICHLDNGRVSIDKPTWHASWKEGRFTLTGAVHWARHVGERRQYSQLIGSMEYWLARSYDRRSSGVAPLLRPESDKPGAGPWAPAPGDGLTEWWKWHEVLEVLMLERIDKNDLNARKAALGRYDRIVKGLQVAGYVRSGGADNGDVVEVETRAKKRRVTPALRFRATARFCEAARLSQEGKWSTTTLFNWTRVPDAATASSDAERERRQKLRERRKALTLEEVEEALRLNNNNVAKAEHELGVGGSDPGSYLRGWLRKHRS